MAILYCGRNLIGSQCSSCRSGITGLYLDFLRTSFAALFWTLCKCEICFKSNPARMELQYSSRDVMADEMSWAVALWVKYGRIEAILLSSRYAARHTLLVCCCIDSVWSRWTPRFLTEDLNGMRLPPMSKLSLPTELRLDATGRTSVFSAFSLSLLLYIQPTRLSMQVWISQRLKLIGRSPLWQLGIISVFVIITLVATYQVREGLRVQCEQDWPKDRTLWNPKLKGAGRGQDVVNFHRLFMAL